MDCCDDCILTIIWYRHLNLRAKQFCVINILPGMRVFAHSNGKNETAQKMREGSGLNKGVNIWGSTNKKELSHNELGESG
jgi:hypothetical protein